MKPSLLTQRSATLSHLQLDVICADKNRYEVKIKRNNDSVCFSRLNEN